jgi:hypothetical protein
MQHLKGSGTPVLYIGRTVLKGLALWKNSKILIVKSSWYI